MKYLEGSRFSVHVGSTSYAEGWDRIFGPKAEPPDTAQAPLRAEVPPGCFGCERIHAAEQKCYCECHSL